MAALQPSAIRQLYLGVPVEAESLHQNPAWKAWNLLSPSLDLMATYYEPHSVLNRKMHRYCLLPKATIQVMGQSSPPLSHNPGTLTDSPCALTPPWPPSWR